MGARNLTALRVAALAMVVSTLAGSCGQLLGVDEYRLAAGDPDGGASYAGEAGTERSAACGGDLHVRSDCSSCLQESCCDEGARCRSDPGCASFTACTAACRPRDGECFHACFQDHRWTQATGEWLACTVEHCGAPCTEPGQVLAQYGRECGGCVARVAQEELEACMASEDCRALVACLTVDCGDWVTKPECMMNCHADHPAGLDHFRPFADEAGRCSGECGWGTHWECSATQEVRRPQDGATELTFSVSEQRERLPGVMIRLCNGAREDSCRGALVTDDRGEVTLSINEDRPFEYLELTASDGARMLHHPGQHEWIGERATVAMGLLTLDGLSELLPDVDFPEGTGALLVVAWDCAGSLGVQYPERSGIRLEVDGDEGPGYSERLYRKESAFQRDLPHGTSALFTGVPPGRVTVRVYAPGGDLHSERPAFVRADTFSHVSVGIAARGGS